MKTILYNPVFINPQAYFVFPQLYDIEKGDSFIEPAAYAGQLMIENLTDNTKLMLENNVMQVDFTQFAGKHIRINQYTNIGAVVLGEWLLPEGEPSGPSFHESLVDAWVMSGLSNSTKPTEIIGVKGNSLQLKNFAYALDSGFGKYTEDFTKWNRGTEKTAGYAELKYASTTLHQALLYLYPQTDEIISLKVKITGLKAGQALYFGSWDELNHRVDITKDGIYEISYTHKKDSAQAAGFRSAGAYTDIDVTVQQLPTAYEGALVFDGVDDYAYVDNFDTLIDGDEFTTIGYYEVIPQGNKSSYNLYARSSNANWSRIETPSITTSSYGKRSYTVNYTSNTSSYDILEGESFKMDKAYKVFPKRFFLSGWFDEANNYLFDISKVAHYWVAIYKGKLTPEEIETEKERLNKEWLKRKTD